MEACSARLQRSRLCVLSSWSLYLLRSKKLQNLACGQALKSVQKLEGSEKSPPITGLVKVSASTPAFSSSNTKPKRKKMVWETNLAIMRSSLRHTG